MSSHLSDITLFENTAMAPSSYLADIRPGVSQGPPRFFRPPTMLDIHGSGPWDRANLAHVEKYGVPQRHYASRELPEPLFEVTGEYPGNVWHEEPNLRYPGGTSNLRTGLGIAGGAVVGASMGLARSYALDNLRKVKEGALGVVNGYLDTHPTLSRVVDEVSHFDIHHPFDSVYRIVDGVVNTPAEKLRDVDVPIVQGPYARSSIHVFSDPSVTRMLHDLTSVC
jgi:hypothetical protein